MKNEADRQRKRFGKPFEESLVRSDNGCLLWTGRVDKDGYGLRGSRFGERRAHRFAFARVHGGIPPGIIVMHSCDTPRCCNEEHLFAGTDVLNVEDKVSKGRQARGEKNSHAKLTTDAVEEIRSVQGQGVTQTEIAEAYQVSQSAISLIVLRKNWKHI